MAAHPAFLKAYKSLVEKPGNAEHSAKWDRCVEEVKRKGGSDNAYAVCTAMLGSGAFKSMEADDPNFGKEVETFMRTLGIAGAGPVPSSLLARQDLEGSTRKSAFRKSESEHDMTIEIHNGSDSEGMSKTGDKCYVVMVNGMEYSRFYEKKEAEECMNILEQQGTFATLLEQTVVNTTDKAVGDTDDEYESEQATATNPSETRKGAVETTGKQLDRAVAEAKKAEDTEETDNLVDNIKHIQQRRQKATIAARKPKGTFKSVWSSLNKNGI